MLNKLHAPLLLSTALIITACGGGGSNNNADSIQGVDSNGKPFRVDGDLPDINIRTWQEEFKKHQDQAGALAAQGDGYVVTDMNELLLYRLARFSSTGTGNFSPSQANINGVIYPKNLIAIGGKVFIDEKRIYDIAFLQKLSTGDLTQKELDTAAKTYGVIPNQEDKVLLEEYAAGKRSTTLIKDLAKTDNSTPEQYIPKLGTQSWQDALKAHQEKVKTLKDDPRKRYRITDKNELLVLMPTAMLSALKESDPKLDIPPHITYISSTALIFFLNDEIKNSLITINGKIFVGTQRFDESKENIRRVYDTDLLLQLT